VAGTVLAVGVVGCAAVLSVGLTTAGLAAVQSQRAADAADAAALAAADTASGAANGVACDRATEVAGAGGASVTACRLDGLIATVSVSVPFGPLHAMASARAGPPPGGS
jgi:secretion/DNA translocation related TadE-like protein